MRSKIAVVAIGVLFLAGCGGGSDNATPAPTNPPQPVEPAAVVSTANGEVSNVDAVLKEVDADIKEAEASAATDEGDLTK